MCGVKAKLPDVFLELGNGEKFLSRGLIPDVPIVTAGLTIKLGLTVTNLLHEVELVLGMTWLQLVNPIVNWGSGKLYVPNSVQTALLHGSWLQGHMQAGIFLSCQQKRIFQSSKRNGVRLVFVY